jgi:hypothetical protein
MCNEVKDRNLSFRFGWQVWPWSGAIKPGCKGMSIELQKGERLLKLKDSTLDGPHYATEQDLTVVRLWQLLSDGQSLRDGAVVERQFL